MTFSLVHFSDTHFGAAADLRKIEGLENLIPDLEPSVIVLSGDLTLRARHGEFLAAHALVRELGRTAPVYVLPGNHDVTWWRRPFVPFAPAAKYAKYQEYFGPQLTPTLEFSEAVITGALTAHGVAWGSLTPRLRDIAVKGHLRRRDIRRAKEIFDQAPAEKVRILVVHHNVLPGDASQRMGLARWRQAQRRIVESGADIVLCGHDHQEKADVLDGVVISCAGTVSARTREGSPSTFHRLSLEGGSAQVEVYRWESDNRVFRRSDVYVFALKRIPDEAELSTGAV